MAINRLNPDYPDAGLVQLMPSSVAVGSGSSTVNGNGQVSFSGASSVSLNDVFSSTYDNYRIIITSISATSEHSMNLRLRVAGSDVSTVTYIYAEQVLGSNGTSYNQLSTGATSILVGRTGSNGVGSIVIDIAQPFLANRTTTNSASAANGTTTSLFKGNGAGLVANTTSYTGFTIFPTGSTLTGKVSVYGYNF